LGGGGRRRRGGGRRRGEEEGEKEGRGKRRGEEEDPTDLHCAPLSAWRVWSIQISQVITPSFSKKSATSPLLLERAPQNPLPDHLQ
jgi:hypothetical protein